MASSSNPSVLSRPYLLRGKLPARDVSGDRAVDLLTTHGESTITVARVSQNDVGIREVYVSVDGNQIAILRHGESITHQVAAGAHTVRAHNTLFWKTHQITLKPGEDARFTAINRAGFGTFGLLFFLGAMPVYLTFERVQPTPPAGAP